MCNRWSKEQFLYIGGTNEQLFSRLSMIFLLCDFLQPSAEKYSFNNHSKVEEIVSKQSCLKFQKLVHPSIMRTSFLLQPLAER